MAPVEYSTRGEVSLITLNNPPVNALAQPVRQAILAYLQHAIDDTEIKAIVITGSGGCFSAGADIREFNHPEKFASPLLAQVVEQVENSRKPVVAAIDGIAFGGE